MVSKYVKLIEKQKSKMVIFKLPVSSENNIVNGTSRK